MPPPSENGMPDALPTVDESYAQLHPAGWSVGDSCVPNPAN